MKSQSHPPTIYFVLINFILESYISGIDDSLINFPLTINLSTVFHKGQSGCVEFKFGQLMVFSFFPFLFPFHLHPMYSPVRPFAS